MRDDVRSSCFAALDVLQAQHGPELPYAALAGGFSVRGRKVPFLNRAYGIYRAAHVQRGAAALSINSAFAQKRYQDEGTADGVLHRYQDGPIDNHFNTWLRQAHVLGVSLVYFIGTRPNWYRPEYPAFVEADYPAERSVLISFGEMRGPLNEREPVHIGDPIERRYVVRLVKQRIHQAQFRGAVLLADRDRCAICTLKEIPLLDAAHIVADAKGTRPTTREPQPEPLLDSPPSVRRRPRRHLSRPRGACLAAAPGGRGRADARAAEGLLWPADRRAREQPDCVHTSTDSRSASSASSEEPVRACPPGCHLPCTRDTSSRTPR